MLDTYSNELFYIDKFFLFRGKPLSVFLMHCDSWRCVRSQLTFEDLLIVWRWV